MRKTGTNSTAFKTVAKPVTVKFKLKSGKTVSIKAVRTFREKRSARVHARG
jgi:hypothetical protein